MLTGVNFASVLLTGLDNIKDTFSALCYFIRDAEKHGHITGKEDWLANVNWRTS
jgi:hypothetical protein